jgi:hypothetical protein
LRAFLWNLALIALRRLAVYLPTPAVDPELMYMLTSETTIRDSNSQQEADNEAGSRTRGWQQWLKTVVASNLPQ